MQKKIYQKIFGAELIDFDKQGFTVRKEGKQYHFCFCDNGSYSDWWELSTKIYFNKRSKVKPVITDFKIDNGKGIFTLFGMHKELATLKATFHNDSGWDYGCTVELYCDILPNSEGITLFD